MNIIDGIFKIFSFLSSFLGVALLIIASYLLLGQQYYLPLITGFIAVTLILLITRTSFGKLRRFKSMAKRQGVGRTHRDAFSKAMQNKFFSGHISRAFLIGTIVFIIEPIYIIFASVFSVIVILAMMRLRRISLIKTISSALMGSIIGVASVILTRLFF